MNLIPIKYKVCNDPVVNAGIVNLKEEWPKGESPPIITIESRSVDNSTWTISNGWGCFSKSQLRFIHESSSSNRTEDFIQDSRFSSAEEALEFWKNYWIYYAYYPEPIFRWKFNPFSREKLTEEDKRMIEVVRKYREEKGILLHE